MKENNGITPEQVYLALECMATDMTGAMENLSGEDDKRVEVLNRRIEAIDFVEDLIRKKYKLRFE